MKTKLGHALRKKFYSEQMWISYCLARYERETQREKKKAEECDCRQLGQRCGHPGGRRPPSIKSQPHPPKPPGVRTIKGATPPEHIELGWETEKKSKCMICRHEGQVSSDSVHHRKCPKYVDPSVDISVPCRSCEQLREDYQSNCKQMKPRCPTCGRATRRLGRCSDNWHSGDCSIVYC